MALPLHPIALHPASDNSVSLDSNGRVAMSEEVIHEELRVVGTTLFHCDLAQQIVLARYSVPQGTIVGAGGSAVFALFEIGGLLTRGLCVVKYDGDYIDIHLPFNGEKYSIPLPCLNDESNRAAVGLWPLDIGIALSFDSPVSSLGEGRVPPIPIFTLINPMDEVRPVSETETPTASHRVSAAVSLSASTPPKSHQMNHQGTWRVVSIERRPCWPMAMIVAVETESGRRVVWSLCRMMKEGFEGGRYAARQHEHRKEQQGWRSGALTGGGDTMAETNTSMLNEGEVLYDLPKWSLRDTSVSSGRIDNSTDFVGSLSGSEDKKTPSFLDTTSRLSNTMSDVSVPDTVSNHQYTADCVYEDSYNKGQDLIIDPSWWWGGSMGTKASLSSKNMMRIEVCREMPMHELHFFDPRKGVVSSLELSFLKIGQDENRFDGSLMSSWALGEVGGPDPEAALQVKTARERSAQRHLIRSGCCLELPLRHSSLSISLGAADSRGAHSMTRSDSVTSDLSQGYLPRIHRLAVCIAHSAEEPMKPPNLILTNFDGFSQNLEIKVKTSALSHLKQCNAESFVVSPLLEASLQVLKSSGENDEVVALKPLRVMRALGAFVDVLCDVPSDNAVFLDRVVARVEVCLNPTDGLCADVLCCLDAVFDEVMDSLSWKLLFRVSAIKATGGSAWNHLLHCLASLLNDSVECKEEEVNKPALSEWDQMLNSDYHNKYSTLNGVLFANVPTTKISKETSSIPMSSLTPLAVEKRAVFALSLLKRLHFLYEDRKLDSMAEWQCVSLRELLSALSLTLSLPQFKDHYERDAGHNIDLETNRSLRELSLTSLVKKSGQSSDFETPPCLRSHLLHLLEGAQSGHPACTNCCFTASSHPDLCIKTRKVCRVYETLCLPPLLNEKGKRVNGEASEGDSYLQCARRCVEEMVRCGVSATDLSTLPAGMAVPLYQALRMCRLEPPPVWTTSCYERCGRPDLRWLIGDKEAKMSKLDDTINDVSEGVISGMHSLEEPKDLASSLLNTDSDYDTINSYPSLAELRGLTEEPDLSGKQPKAWAETAEDQDGLVHLEAATSVRFAHDLRVAEVCRLLRSSRSHYLKVHRPPEVSDVDYIQLQQSKLFLLVTRSLASCLGRGALTLGTLKPKATLSEALPIPAISLLGRTPPRDTLVKLDFSNNTPPALSESQMLTWPSFHNGVAAGLRLARRSTDEWQVTRHWIMFNSPVEPPLAEDEIRSPEMILKYELKRASYGGLLMALGMQGHLGCLFSPDVLRSFATEGHEAKSVGVLLGLGCQHKGTSDNNKDAMKSVKIHMPSLYKDTNSNQVASTSKCAALVAFGYLYMGTNNRQAAAVGMKELGWRASDDWFPPLLLNITFSGRDSLEAYSLSAGFAVGLVTLGSGKQNTTIETGTQPSNHVATLPIEQQLQQFVTGGRNPLGSQDRAGEGRVLDGKWINTNVTAPGATIALAFCFLKSNNSDVADRLRLPDTHPMLDYVRPDLLRLRVLARSLVMWDSVTASVEWVLQQIPEMVCDAWSKMGKSNDVPLFSDVRSGDCEEEDEDDGPSSSYFDLQDIQEFIEVKPKPLLDTTVGTPLSDLPKKSISGLDGVDQVAVRQAHANCIAGALLGLAIRFAGTADPDALETLLFFAKHFKSMRDGKPDSSCVIEKPEAGVSPSRAVLVAMLAARKPDKVTLEACVGVSALALGCVMAGTGDLPSLKIIRSLYFKVDNDVTYGNHTAIQLAIGLLFLGGGDLTLGRSNEQIASLVMSLFPFFPADPNDNRYHLQALRQLYAMAAEPRSLVAVDASTKMPVFIPVKVTSVHKPKHVDGGNKEEFITKELVAPCLICINLQNIVRLQINSDRYHRVDLWPQRYPNHAKAIQSLRLFVTRKEGFKSLDVGLLNSDRKSDTQERTQLPSSLDEDPYLLTFFNHMSLDKQPLATPLQQLLKLSLKNSSTDALAAHMPLACFHGLSDQPAQTLGSDPISWLWSLHFLSVHSRLLSRVESRLRTLSGGNCLDWLNELHPIPPQDIVDAYAKLEKRLMKIDSSVVARYLTTGNLNCRNTHQDGFDLPFYLLLHHYPTPAQLRHLSSPGSPCPSIVRLSKLLPLTPMKTILELRRSILTK